MAVFNLGEQAQEMRLTWSDLGVHTASAQVRDLWRHKDLGRLKDLQLNLRPHASALYRVAPQQGRQP